jgi:hypothetical protein
MPQPLALDDDEMQAVLDAAKPLPPDRRAAFLADVAEALATAGEVGPGSLHRVIRVCAARHFDPPRDNGIRAGKHA